MTLSMSPWSRGFLSGERNLVVAYQHGSLEATRQLQEAPVPVVNREVVLPVTRERVWELITEPSELEGWLADEVELEPEEDAPLRVAWVSGEEREGVVEEVADGERIVFRWGDSRVEWILEDHPAGTRLMVTEHRYAAGSLTWGPRLEALSNASLLCPA
jgi:uncharacterized protein YndB with AHSA1/START domain